MRSRSNRSDEAVLAGAVRRYAEEGVPAFIELWPLIEVRRSRRRPLRHRVLPARSRSVALLIALGLLLIGAVTVSAAPPVRAVVTTKIGSALGRPSANQPSHVTGVGISTGREGGVTISTQPATGFKVLSAGYLPLGLSLHTVAYIPARPAPQPGQATAVPKIPILQAGPPGTGPISADEWATISALGKSGVEAVYARFSSPSTDGFVELVQTASVTGQVPVDGESIEVVGQPARLQQSGSETLLQMTVEGTVVTTVRTNLSRAEAIKVAENLKAS